MKIKHIDKTRLRNDEHFMFHTEFQNLLSDAAAVAAKVQTQFTAYAALLAKEDEGLKKINKSALTAKIHDEDKARDELYSGMAELNAAMLKHPDEAKRAAAKRLKIVFDTYGNIAVKPLNEQTSAIINILQELEGQYAQDAQTLRLTEFSGVLKTRNNALEALVRERYDETTAKTDVVIRDARLKVDVAYDDIAARIDAFELVEGGAVYENFIKSLNTVIAKYTAVLNARTGRKHHRHGADGQGAEEPETDGVEGDENV